MALIQYDWHPYKNRKFGHRKAQRGDDVNRQEEDSHLQTQQRSLEYILPSQPSEGTNPVDTWTSCLQNCETINSYWASLVVLLQADGKESACKVRYPGSIPGLGRSPREENGYPLQYSCLENPMDGGAWWARVHEIQKSWMGLSN